MLLTVLTLTVLALPIMFGLGYLCGRHDGREEGAREEQARTSSYVLDMFARIVTAYYRADVSYQVDDRRGGAMSSKTRIGRN